MRIIVDTSVWSEALRRKKKKFNDKNNFLSELIHNDEQIIIIGIVLQEILSGITNPKLFRGIKAILSDFAYIEAMKEDYIYAAEICNLLRNKGYTTGTVDLLIASIAIRNKCYIATYDDDFSYIADNTPLSILNPQKYRNLKKSSAFH